MNIIGKKYGKLTVIDFDGKSRRHVMVKCKCDCGNIVRVRANRLVNGHTVSCGCYRKEKRFIHGLTHTKLYHRWCNMRRRCNDPQNRYYKDYGGRGITVCNEWNNSFEMFYEWAKASGYDDSLTLDRIDNNGNYEPNNCRWVTMEVQSNNRRSSKYIEYQGVTMTLSQWAKHTNIKAGTLYNRLKMNWPIGEALGYERHVRKS